MHPVLKKIHDVIIKTEFESWKEINLRIKANKGYASYKGSLVSKDDVNKPLNIRLLPKDFSDNFIELYDDKSVNQGDEWNELYLKFTPIEIIEVLFVLDKERKNRVDEINKKFNS